MQLIAYILIYPILWLISILPFRLLYGLSDVLWLFLYKIFGYRKSTVKGNLRLVFPEKSEKEISKIASEFYHHLCDLFLEMIKTLSISKKQLNKRFIIRNKASLTKLENMDSSVILMYGHQASYEWSTVIQSHIQLAGLGIYKKIANKYFDGLVKRIRSKYKTELVNTKKALARIEELDNLNDHRMIAFLSDQSPKKRKNNVYLNFMGTEVPCFVGAEITAKKYNYPVAFLQIDKVKRGHYEAEIILLSETPSSEPNFKITEKFNALLEAQIRKQPQYYLWTHKRWKHRNKVPAKFQEQQ